MLSAPDSPQTPRARILGPGPGVGVSVVVTQAFFIFLSTFFLVTRVAAAFFELFAALGAAAFGEIRFSATEITSLVRSGEQDVRADRAPGGGSRM